MMDSRGKLKVVEEAHPLRRQLCPVHMAATFSDTKIKLQALSLTLDDSSLLQEMTSHVHISEVNMSSLKANMCDGVGLMSQPWKRTLGLGLNQPRELAS
jgi:hypothetical protein